jgi:hypothetical protein
MNAYTALQHMQAHLHVQHTIRTQLTSHASFSCFCRAPSTESCLGAAYGLECEQHCAYVYQHLQSCIHAEVHASRLQLQVQRDTPHMVRMGNNILDAYKHK